MLLNQSRCNFSAETDYKKVDGKIQKTEQASRGGRPGSISLPERIKSVAYSGHVTDKACLTYLPTTKRSQQKTENCPECPMSTMKKNMGQPVTQPKQQEIRKSIKEVMKDRPLSSRCFRFAALPLPRGRPPRLRPRPRSSRHIRRQSPLCFLRVLTSSFVMHSGSGLEFSRTGGSTRPIPVRQRLLLHPCRRNQSTHCRTPS